MIVDRFHHQNLTKQVDEKQGQSNLIPHLITVQTTTTHKLIDQNVLCNYVFRL